MLRIVYLFGSLVGGLVLAPLLAAAAEGRKVAVPAVFSQVAKDYQRKQNPDGSFQPEYYLFSFGGQVDRTTTDVTVDHIRSGDFVDLLRRHLAAQNYLLAPDGKSAQLLLRVNWGKTVPFSGGVDGTTATDDVASALTTMSSFGGIDDDGFVSQEEASGAADAAAELESAMIMIQAENRRRDLANQFNAGLLGYRGEMNEWVGSPALLSAGGNRLDDLRGDIEEARYYLLVFAFDFRSVAEKHEPRLRWVTRISIRAPGQRFDENLETMVTRAARYFGRDSKGLVRRYEGTVELGETEVIGVVEDDAADTPPSAPDAGQPGDEKQR
jgi:hypothetical protein